MNKKVLDYTVEKTQELIAAPTCCLEAKTAAQTWLDAIGTEKEATETKNYIAELEADIVPIDNLISLAESDDGISIFGADTAKNIVIHAKEIKAAGAKYCDCPACTAAIAILENKKSLLENES